MISKLTGALKAVNLLVSYVLLVLEQRLGPSAEMVMIDRMFIQEEKVALSQDRVLAKEKPGNGKI